MMHGKPAMTGEKRKGSIKPLIKALKPYTFYIVLNFLFISVSTVLSMLAPQWLSKLTDEIVSHAFTQNIDLTKVMNFAIVLVAFYVSNAVCNYIANFVMTTVTQKFTRGLRSAITVKINRVPLGYFDAHQRSEEHTSELQSH